MSLSPRQAYAIGFFQQVNPPDTTQNAQDTVTEPYTPSRRPTYQPRDRFGSPLLYQGSRSPLYPAPPTQLEYEIDTGFNYTIYESLGGGVPYRPMTTMTLEEYNRYMQQRAISEYWQNQSAGLDGESAVSGRSLIPPIYTSPVFDRIFGGSFVNIRPNGFVNLDFGALIDRIENPALPIRAQRNSQFNFDQQINMSVVGEIGEKLEVMANFDSNNSFDFENNFRVEYTGFEEEIIKKIEIGNVNLPVRNSLLSGSQSLFGVKTQLQFGRLFITGVATTQRGESDAIVIEGGSQSSTFAIRASEYDENQHFFLGHFFREHYGIEQGEWLANLPQITSGLHITRMEVYVINRNNDTQTLRNIAAFTDLAEGEAENLQQPDNPFIGNLQNIPTSNGANGLFENLLEDPDFRSLDNIDRELKGLGFVPGSDYVVIKSARKLSDREYTYHPALGYLSLNRELQSDEALAVAFEYTYNGQRYQVGELTENYQDRPASDVIFMKLLRPNRVNTEIPTWELMMKNIYNLNANQVSREGFQLRIIYRDDRTNIDNPNLQEGVNTKSIPLVQVMGLDRLNQSNDPQPDGNFDFIEGITINLERGNIIFPVLEPFGDHLEEQFLPSEDNLIEKYVYDTLYETTRSDAELVAGKNKFFLEGSFAAGSTTDIALPGINIAEGSVRVFAGNTPLTEGIDYQVDYSFGRVKILNEGIINSGKQLRITYEKASLLNFQTRRFLGTQFDYIINEDFSIGGTLLYLNELPNTTRTGIGEEPSKNTKWGLDLSYRTESRFLTKMVDMLPLIQTKELSTLTFNSEFAQLLSGTSNKVDGEGTSYIDDFEAAISPYNISSNPLAWSLAATPETDDNRFFGLEDGLLFGARRAKLAWYNVDDVFYSERDRSRLAPNLSKTDIQNHYFRPVTQQEIFQRDANTYNPYEPILDLVYFPAERGPYNYNPLLEDDATLPNPEENWGGITRAITSEVDFDQANIEYIEFWMLDPFITGENGRDAAFEEYEIVNEREGGKLIFNLGSISEDYIKDNKHGFENGLPPNESLVDPQIDTTEWGRVTNRQFLNNAFDVDAAARLHQDIGMDGLRSENEAEYFEDFIRAITPEARAAIAGDISADDFRYFLGEELNAADANIITRYKDFNNQEGNTPIFDNNSDYRQTGSPEPDNEDLNEDNAVNVLEEYFQYEIELSPDQLEVGKNYVVDKVTTTPFEGSEKVSWYLFRIPIREYEEKYGNINSFKSIRFLRTYLTGFENPVALRIANMQLVGSQWRQFPESLQDDGLGLIQEGDETDLTISAVSYENNGRGGAGDIPYVVPPGFIRDRDNTAYNQDVRLNEQSLQICVEDLENEDARAVYKNVSLDLVNYGTIKMLMHAQAYNNPLLQDGEVTAFLRLGTDYTQNYYEIEIPLEITPPGATDPREIWPEQNEINLAIDELFQLKALRNRLNKPLDSRFGAEVGKHNIYVEGNPDLSAIQVLMIGLRNPDNPGDKSAKSVCLWTNELRVTDFDSRAGWATNARLNTKLADLANITASTRLTTVGFGNIGDKIAQRSRDKNLSYDISASVALDKFLPEKARLQVPLFVSYEKSIITPYYDPANPDLPLTASLDAFETAEERLGYRAIVEDRATRRSFNFTNIRVNRKEGDKPGLIDLENFALTYAYSDVMNSSWERAKYELVTQKAAIGYNFSPIVNPIEPFANTKAFQSPYLQLLRDFNFNPVPSNLSFRWDLDRRFVATQLRNSDLTTVGIDPQYEKLFTFNRLYNFRWDLANSLSIDYSARANAVVDEPDGYLDTQIKRDEVLDNLAEFGRMKHFDQSLGATYQLPLDKTPFTNWLSAETRYETNFSWTAGSLGQIEEFGNTIQNSRNYQLTGRMDLVKLYNKVAFLKKVNEGRPQPRGPLRPGQKPAEEEEAAASNGSGLARGITRLLMSVRSVNFNYSRTQGTLLPGFEPRVFLFGLDSGFVAPGLPFLLGSQDPDIRFRAVENDWMVRSVNLSTPFTQTNNENIDLRADVQPLEDFRIQLDWKKTKTANYQELFRYDITEEWFDSFTPTRSGSYSISYLPISTTFDGLSAEGGSENFERFAAYRDLIEERLQPIENENGGVFSERSQDVLIPAFIAAYTGRDPSKVKLSPFPSMPMPNWRVDYAGLSKIPAIRERFSAITLSHSYVSRYSVNSYINSSQYQLSRQLSLDNNIEEYTSEDNVIRSSQTGENNLVPLYVANQVVITEQFAPLIGVNLRTKSRFNFQVNYNRERNLALILSNTQVTEQRNEELRLDVGYTTSNLKLPFRSKGREVILKNDITFRMGMSLRSSKTVQRKFDEPDDITMGSVNFQLNPTINYLINQRLSIQLYYSTSINDPLVLTSFRNTQTRFGTQIRFNITQ
ncbi:T9SS outer membrane translocon Sov/SprA [Nafulsella turpanensis]|uniref:T9SS outer membrane translocon Sov/SprA n=1 Tax=Nafulsella turpanensis TaxID=1265690 RepID=UPI0003471925|nr:cell surface protein SprA [Nafulsella turpanensis]